jgi:hypothetical protein
VTQVCKVHRVIRCKVTLAAYSWTRDGDTLVGTVTESSWRAGIIECGTGLRSRVASRYRLVYDADHPIFDGRVVVTLGADDQLRRLEVTASGMRTLTVTVEPTG